MYILIFVLPVIYTEQFTRIFFVDELHYIELVYLGVYRAIQKDGTQFEWLVFN